jgi:predicted Zn-dependent protease
MSHLESPKLENPKVEDPKVENLKATHQGPFSARLGSARLGSARSMSARLLAIVTAVALGASGFPVPAEAQGRGPPVIRDAEIEQLLKEYTQPILKAAGLTQQNVRVVIINDRSFNAFVADGRRIFVNAGTIMVSDTPNEVIGVLAHEAGHMAGGHLARLREQLAAASTQAILAMLLGVGAMVAASRTGSANMGQAGMAAIQGPQAMIQNNLLAYVRTQEDSADRAGVRFLEASGQSAKGMHDSFKRLADQLLYNSRFIDPYMQSHPLPAERVRALQGLASASPNWDKKDASGLQTRHDMVRAKLYGFMDRPDAVVRRYPLNDNSLPARYARAIATYRFGSSAAAGVISQIDSLIQAQPQNPYFHELKGQALLEAGKAAESVAPLRRAVQLAPSPPLIQIMLAQALLGTNDKAHAEEAVNLLETALRREPESSEAYNQLAMAYGRKGDLARADLASAQSAFMRGDLKTARQLATRAKTLFPVGSPGWVKSDDISSYKPKPYEMQF